MGLQDEREEAMKTVKMYQASDWSVKEENEAFILMERNSATTTGHLLILLFFGWWTFGLANLIYYLVSKKTKKIIK